MQIQLSGGINLLQVIVDENTYFQRQRQKDDDRVKLKIFSDNIAKVYNIVFINSSSSRTIVGNPGISKNWTLGFERKISKIIK